ncbi:hypothetical protein Agabi119p4_2797 [Agaricus bisporus var. burnettii]|uniref:Uncharacterized protein n=1 Tax=Agaricus bisporus var. burnettii TaxID=192524 RepID=A0A8H7F5U5_AGABI|nr:hypothetical protein Agabi119p4_2797 [Agaricus bisporus var. burnettii]
MSLFRVLYRHPNHLSLLACRRASTVVASTATKNEITKKKSPAAPTTPISSCVENTKIEGVNYLKSQAPVLALPDDHDRLRYLLCTIDAVKRQKCYLIAMLPLLISI